MPEPQPVLDASETIQFNKARRLCHLPHDGTKPIKMLHVSLLPQAIDMPHGRQETNTLLFSGPVTKAGWDVSPRFVCYSPKIMPRFEHRASPVGQQRSQPHGLVNALDGDDSIGEINEPNEGPCFGSRIFPSIGLPTADGARVLKII